MEESTTLTGSARDLSDDEDYQVLSDPTERLLSTKAKVTIINQSDNATSSIVETQSGESFDLNQITAEEAPTWWTREEQARLLDDILSRPMPAASGDDARGDFERRKDASQILYQSESGAPLIHKRIIWPGSGVPVTEDSSVSFHLTAFIEDDPIPFDCSVTRGKPLLVRLDTTLVINGVRLALLSMIVGERAEFIVQPELAYGKNGCLERIPPNQEIRFVITVQRVHSEGSVAKYLTMTSEELKALPLEEVIQVVNSEKQSGNNYYNTGQYTKALIRYRRAMKFLWDSLYAHDEPGEQVDEIFCKLLMNAGNASLQLQDYEKCVQYAKFALKFNDDNVKALYLCGAGYLRLEKLDQSKEMLNRAYRLKQSREISQLLLEVAQREEANAKTTTQLYTVMAQALNLPPRH